jgi:beta-N-acetylhexosaminidase
VSFVPTSSKHTGQACHGVQLHVTCRESFDPVATALHLIAACREQAPDEFMFLPSSWEGGKPHFDLLAGSSRLREALTAGQPVRELVRNFESDLEHFEMIRRKSMLY